MRRANRKDANHQEIVKGLRERGIIVFDMPEPGDILCYGQIEHAQSYIWIPMEVKSSQPVRGYKPELTPAQQRRSNTGAVIPIVHSLAEGLALFGLKE